MTKVIVIAGTAGTGKSTIGLALSSHFQTEFIEGDDLHPQANIDKMGQGIPLTDEDRWDWLEKVSIKSSEVAAQTNSGVSVVSCSSLKKIYRDYIHAKSPSTEFLFVFLYCEASMLIERVSQRKGHFMKSDMIKSQFDILELPAQVQDAQVEKGCIVLDVTNTGVENVIDEALGFVDRHKTDHTPF